MKTARAARANSEGGARPWASGRVLTAEQRARKQETDRKASRVLKREVQERLAFLEARVLTLEQQQQRPDPASTNPDHQPASTGVAQSSLDTTTWPTTTTAPPGDAPLPQTSTDWQQTGVPNTHTFDANQLVPSLPNPSLNSASPETIEPTKDVGYVPFVPSSSRQNNQISPQFAPPVWPLSAGRCYVPTPLREFENLDVFSAAHVNPGGLEVADTFNKLVSYVRALSPAMVCFDDACNQDVIVTALIKTWEAALQRYQQACPLWHVLRLVDACLFRACGLVERLAVLRMLHKMYLFEVTMSAQSNRCTLPSWLQPLASQQMFSHEPVLDHIFSPLLREHFVMLRSRQATNYFWARLAVDLNFIWPGEPPDCIAVGPHPQAYRLAPAFDTAMQDVSNWRMDTRFMDAFPHLSGCVLPADYMPLMCMMPTFGTGEAMAGKQRREEAIEVEEYGI